MYDREQARSPVWHCPTPEDYSPEIAAIREQRLAAQLFQVVGEDDAVQLTRSRSPRATIADYLRGVNAEGVRRGYAFDARKIGRAQGAALIAITRGQLLHE